ncbi:MAG TPA: hypothetical protein VE650_13590 [Acetobacteraceae bacterium]|jgi:hypothetical protein|nr:hypothetical protein [Acetobacteraceae bacterium]
MRAVELAKVAAAAEALRLRRFARRQGMRAAFGAGAAVFGIAVFVLLHVLAYHLLRLGLGPVVSSLILLAVDVIVAGVLAFLAMRNEPDEVEREALAIRRQAVQEAKRAATVMAVAGEAARLLIRRRARSAVDNPRRSRAWLIADIASRVLARR